MTSDLVLGSSLRRIKTVLQISTEVTTFTHPSGLEYPGVGLRVSGRAARVFLLAVSRLEASQETRESRLLLVRLLDSMLS